MAGHRRAPSDPRILERVRQGLREHESARVQAVRRVEAARPPERALSFATREAPGAEAAPAP